MKKRYCVGSNTVWEQVFRKLLIKYTLLTAQMADFIWDRLVPILCQHVLSSYCQGLHSFGRFLSESYRSKASLNTAFFYEAQFIQNGLTSYHIAHIWSSKILHLSACLSFSVNMPCCFISSHHHLICFAFPTRWATTHLEESPGHMKHVVAK